MLNSHPDFAEIIESCWSSLSFAGSKMFLISKKLKEIKSIIRSFSRENFSELEKRVTESFLELQSYQQALLATPTPALAVLERNAHKKWIMLAKAEESFLRQRSRIQWLAEGDSNSAFFHRAIRSRAAQNFINMLLDSNDAVIDDPQDIRAHIIDFYQGLLGCPVLETASSPDLIAGAAGLLKSNIGNGKLTSFWYDNWTPFGQLIKFIGPHGPRELGVPSDATVASVIRNGGWNLRPARSDEAAAFQIHLSTVYFPHPSAPDDEFCWCANDIELDHFSAKHTWESLRPRATTQPWTANVWFKGGIPRHAFHFWITHIDRLPTRARLSIQALEDRDHLFLRCEVSEHLWTLILRRLGYGRFFFHTWLAFVTWMGDRDSVTPLTLRRLASQATIYTIWTERNSRLHNNVSSSTEALFKKLDRQLKDIILARRNRKAFKGLLQLWLATE
ncbi:hypothetical protein Bca101_025451 [Brassica carinata]